MDIRIQIKIQGKPSELQLWIRINVRLVFTSFQNTCSKHIKAELYRPTTPEVKVITYSKIYAVKVYSLNVEKLIQLCNYQSNQDIDCIHHPEYLPIPHWRIL